MNKNFSDFNINELSIGEIDSLIDKLQEEKNFRRNVKAGKFEEKLEALIKEIYKEGFEITFDSTKYGDIEITPNTCFYIGERKIQF